MRLPPFFSYGAADEPGVWGRDSSMTHPKSIAHYQVLGLLGTGGMGEVYLAEDPRLGRRVALKILPPAARSPEASRAFQREARAASALNHPNILTIYEVGSDGDREYIATEYVEGRNLREILIDDPPSTRETVGIMTAVAEALLAAHRAGIVHRDLKPENVMVRPDGMVKVLDFGLSTLQGEPAGESLSYGTIHYTSPEQLSGGRVDERADLWSFGVLLFELLTGRPPFDAPSRVELAEAIVTEEPPPLSRERRAFPESLQQIVTRCLEKSPEQRYRGAGELISDLRVAQADVEKRHEAVARTAASGSAMVIGGFTALILLGIVLIAVWLSTQRHDDRAHDSIAVLPFVNGGGPEGDILADGLTESIIRDLSSSADLRVMARASVYRYRRSGRDPRQIGHELEVDTVLAGRVEEREGRVIVSAELIDVVDGSRMWGREYSRTSAELHDIEEHISQRISAELKKQLRGHDGESPRSAEAHRLYLEGRYLWNKRTLEGFRAAIERYEKALEADPGYAQAYAGIADAYNLIASYGDTPPADVFPRARAAALKAIELDFQNAEAHNSLAYALQCHYYDWKGAEREYRRAIELSPSYAVAHHWYGGFLMLQGRFREAVEHRLHALELDPLSPAINAAVGSPWFLARRYDRAIELYRKGIEMDPKYARGHYALGWALLQSGKVDEGLTHIETARHLSGDPSEPGAETGYAYAIAGRREEARAILDRLRRTAKDRYVDSYDLARIEIALGNHDRAFEDLQRAWEQRSYQLINVLVDPCVDAIRKDPRYHDLLRRMRLQPPPEWGDPTVPPPPLPDVPPGTGHGEG